MSPCTLSADCDDGAFCNGAETCVPSSSQADARGCVAAASPCAVLCDEALDRCGGCDDDLDGDGARSIACGGNDCDDDDMTRFPGNLEVCDVAGVDEDCNPLTLGGVDVDQDQQVDDSCCNGTTCGLDCDDSQPNVHRLAPEVCDGFDNDCNGDTDEGLLVTSWPDPDDDGWGDASATPMMTCTLATGRVDRGGDCDESDDAIHPEAAELCNGVDDNCDEDTDEDGAAACQTALPGSVALCEAGACIITGCTGTRFDCNGSFADGCEVDTCTSVPSCGGCGQACWEIGATCGGGVCSHGRDIDPIAGVLRDATTGAPIAGATITLIGTCGTITATTDAGGNYSLSSLSSWARVQAPGYPTHVQRHNAMTGYGPIVSQAVLDAWLATEGLTVDPTRAIVIADLLPDTLQLPVVNTTREGTHHFVPANTLTSGGSDDQVMLNVLPGRATVGGTEANAGCFESCGALTEVMLEPGAVTFTSGFSCSLACT